MNGIDYSVPLPILETKASGDSWSVSGYASTFGAKDHVDDVMLPGAFDATLGSGRKVRFLYMHDQRQPLGAPLELRTDSHGLFGTFKISKTRLGEEVHQLLEDGALDSFSIGFVTKDKEYKDDGTRHIKSLDLYECSIVSLPADSRALVTSFKSPFVVWGGAPDGFDDWLKTEVKRQLDAHAAARSFDPTEMPFDQAWTQIATTLTRGVEQAKALDTRRRTEGRTLAERHQQAIRDALRALEGASVELHALLSSPAPEAPATAAEAKDAPPSPTTSTEFQTMIARRKARFASPGNVSN